MVQLFIPLFLCLLLAGPVMAERSFPAGVKPAELLGVEYPQVRIGDRSFRLAPGVRIYDQQNRLILPNAMPQTGLVLFRLDLYGNLQSIWILSPEEAARLSR